MRRRGAPEPTGPRRRSTSVSGNAWQSPSTGGGKQGSYGYTPGNYQGKYPSGKQPTDTKYGYNGYNKPGGLSTGQAIAIGAGAGIVAGIGGYWLYQRLTYSNSFGSCRHDSWTGNCNECRNSYGNGGCRYQEPNNYQFSRDDIFEDTGFYPADWVQPLKLIIKAVDAVPTSTGPFATATMCPPSSLDLSNMSDTSWMPPANYPIIWASFTQVSELSTMQSVDGAQTAASPVWVLLFAVAAGRRLLRG